MLGPSLAHFVVLMLEDFGLSPISKPCRYLVSLQNGSCRCGHWRPVSGLTLGALLLPLSSTFTCVRSLGVKSPVARILSVRSPDVRSPDVRCPDEIYPDVQSPNVRSPDALVIVVVKRSLIALQYCRNGDTRDTCGGGNTRKSWCPSCKRHPPMGAPIPQWATIRVCLFSTHTLYILG